MAKGRRTRTERAQRRRDRRPVSWGYSALIQVLKPSTVA
jgi:hypothetical protein